MRSIGLIILIAVAFTWADEPPPPPRVMHIYMNDSTTDSILCSRVDPDVGVTFHENGMKMKVGLIVNPSLGSFQQSTLWYLTSLIDSITFDFVGGPPYVFTNCPVPNQIFHIGETITLQWKLNPLVAGEKAFFEISKDGGANWNLLTQKVCSMMYRDAEYACDTACHESCWPWPYVGTADGLIGTWQIVITDPMVLPDVDPQFGSPVSESVIIRIHDFDINDIEHVCSTPLFSIKP